MDHPEWRVTIWRIGLWAALLLFTGTQNAAPLSARDQVPAPASSGEAQPAQGSRGDGQSGAGADSDARPPAKHSRGTVSTSTDAARPSSRATTTSVPASPTPASPAPSSPPAASAPKPKPSTPKPSTTKLKPSPPAPKPPAPEAQEELLSLNLRDVEVREALRLLAELRQRNLVMSDSVAGRITLLLRDVPWDEGLEAVLRIQGLGKRELGPILLVAPMEELVAREQQLEAGERSQRRLRTETLVVRHADATALVELLKQGLGTAGGKSATQVRFAVDERTNTLVVTATQPYLTKVQELLRQLDVPVRQVLIEATIAVVDSQYSRALGVRWQGRATEDQWALAGNLEGLAGARDPGGDGGNNVAGLLLDLAAGKGATSIAFGYVGDMGLLNLELSALEASGRAQVISRPKIITTDRRQANIQSGSRVPYQQAAGEGVTSISFEDALLKLEVTPHIIPESRIMMNLRINQDSVGTALREGEAAQVPVIDTTQLETRVLVDDGATVVLGGVFQSREQDLEAKTPLLGDIPLLGALFRRVERRRMYAETLIFITPHILDGGIVPAAG